VPRLLWLALAVLVSLPSLHATSALFTSSAFLLEFLSDGAWRPLSWVTEAPSVQRLGGTAAAGIDADLYRCPALWRAPAMVLVHGIAPTGNDDPRLRRAAQLLARAGWAVAVPTIPGLTTLRLRPEDAETVVATIERLESNGYPRVAVLGVSLGSAPALIGAADPRVSRSVSAVLALGGYGSAVDLLRYTLTGSYAFDDRRGHHPVDEAAIAEFVRANRDLVGPAGARLVENRDPGAFDPLVAALPADTRRLLAALSPERALRGLHAPLFLVHGRADPAVPFTESLRLERAAQSAGRPVRTAIVGVVGHVDPAQRATVGDLLKLWAVFHAFRMTAA
jgi:pimeloyl-ACP methyl ester carboxylesterase